MRRSLGLLYYLLFNGKGASHTLPEPSEISGPVVWLVAHDLSEVRSFINIAKKLEATGPEIHLLITGPESLGVDLDLPKTMSFRPMPGQRRSEIVPFLKAWNPVVCFWAGTSLRPGIVYEAYGQQVPLILLNCAVETLLNGQSRLERWLMRRSARAFYRAFTLSYGSGGTCVRLGIPEEHVHVSGPLSEGILALPCDTEDLDRLSGQLAGRELWLAARTPDDEVDMILSVHEKLRGTNRRLLLVLDPVDRAECETLALGLVGKGWKIALRSKNDPITDQTQIVITDRPNELGLWYRLSPIAYMGGTHTKRDCGQDPRQAAALGSAILHGPRMASHKTIYDQMHAQTPPAAKRAVTPEGMVKAISDLLSPDQAAKQAHSAWEYASRGAELTDQITGIITEAVELRG